MTYDLSNELDIRKAEARWEALRRKGAVVDLTEKTARSLNQNSYVHLIIGVVAMETGVTLDYAKEQYFKRLVNPALFVRERYDPLVGKATYLRSSSELTREEMSAAIDRFRDWAAGEGWYLPSPDDKSLLQSVECQMGKQGRWL